MARVLATLYCALQNIEPQQPGRRRPQQQQQQQQPPAVISDAAVEAAEQMARLLLQARQEVLFVCCRVAFLRACWEQYCQGITFVGCEVISVVSLQEEDADKQQAAAKAAHKKHWKQAKAGNASNAAAAAAAPGSSDAGAAPSAAVVQPGAGKPMHTSPAAEEAAKQPDSSTVPPAADGLAARAHAWQLCPLTKVPSPACSVLASNVNDLTLVQCQRCLSCHAYGMTRQDRNGSTPDRAWQC
jgi:hypothetical protein